MSVIDTPVLFPHATVTVGDVVPCPTSVGLGGFGGVVVTQNFTTCAVFDTA
ncbi:hypothetical protein [Alicyclobacillus acidocaldarius]|uniref:hypothetical protein n=1 Tax=Alicyclobacillus acidocaldarius TaxID=405212 RepID=UPI00130511EB|nr:hypothetical protein [Alicyclobacillus acidocaldarius]